MEDSSETTDALLESLEGWKKKTEFANSQELTDFLALVSQITDHFTPDQVKEILEETSDWRLFDDFHVLFRPVEEIEDKLLHPTYTKEHLQVLLALGTNLPNVYGKFLAHDNGWTELLDIISGSVSAKQSNLMLASLEFASILLVTDEFPLSDLNYLSEDTLCLLIYSLHEHQDSSAELVSACLEFLTSLHYQFTLKKRASSPTSTTSASSAYTSPVLNVILLESMHPVQSSLSHALLHFYNRIDSLTLLESLLDLLATILVVQPSFFYLNDTIVLFDITLRHVNRIPDSSQDLRHLAIRLLPVIVSCLPVGDERTRALQDQLERKLEIIVESVITPTLTKSLCVKLLKK